MEKISAFCFIHLAHQRLEEFLEKIRQLPEIKHYSVVTGEFDGVLEIEVDDMAQLYDLFKRIDKIGGIDATNTHIVMKRFDF